MVASGDWVTPHLNGLKYFEKPPLQYWATAAAFKLFGENETSARLYVGLCGLATILLIGFAGMRLMNPEAGLAAMLVLVSSPYFLALGGIVTLDMGLTLWTTATVCSLLLAENAAEPRARRRWMLAAWAAMALAVLSKGLIGIVFPAAAIFLYCVMRRDLAILRRLEWLRGALVFLALAAPWFVLVSLANPEFARFFFIHEHFQRFLTQSHRRVEPAWYFVPVLAVGFLPWVFALPSAIAQAWRSEAGARGPQPLRLLLAYSAFVVVFFSASGSKLPAYILPAFPPLALAIGRYLAQAPPRRLMDAPRLRGCVGNRFRGRASARRLERGRHGAAARRPSLGRDRGGRPRERAHDRLHRGRLRAPLAAAIGLHRGGEDAAAAQAHDTPL